VLIPSGSAVSDIRRRRILNQHYYPSYFLTLIPTSPILLFPVNMSRRPNNFSNPPTHNTNNQGFNNRGPPFGNNPNSGIHSPAPTRSFNHQLNELNMATANSGIDKGNPANRNFMGSSANSNLNQQHGPSRGGIRPNTQDYTNLQGLGFQASQQSNNQVTRGNDNLSGMTTMRFPKNQAQNQNQNQNQGPANFDKVCISFFTRMIVTNIGTASLHKPDGSQIPSKDGRITGYD